MDYANTASDNLVIGFEGDKTVIGVAQPQDDEDRLAYLKEPVVPSSVRSRKNASQS